MPRIVTTSVICLSRDFRKLTACAALAALACGFGTSALAEDAKIKSMSFETLTPYKKNTVKVSSSTGAKWDTILPGQVEFWAHMQVDTKYPGYVQDAGIFLGPCVDTQCGEGSPLIFRENAMSRDYDRSMNVSFSTSKFQISSIIPATVPYGDEVLNQCNKGLQPDGATKPHEFDLPITLAFTVNTRKDAGSLDPGEVYDTDTTWGGGDETRHGEFIAHVECLATSNSTADSIPDPHRNKVTVSKLDLFLATVANPAASRAPSGTQCKPVRVTTRIASDKAGPVTVKQWRQVNGGPITSESKQMNATELGGGKFGDDWVKIEQFTKTTTVQYKDEVVGGTFAPSTPWKSITVHCNGDYASPTSNNVNPDNRKKEAEKQRLRDANARLVRPVIVQPRPLVGQVMLPPAARRPMLGVPLRPMGMSHGPGYPGRGSLFR